MSDHPAKPTKQAYEKARLLWGDARGVTEGIREVTDYGFQEGADYELEACCAWLEGQGMCSSAQFLRLSRRPTLKTRALVALNRAVSHGESFASSEATNVIREALESIDE